MTDVRKLTTPDEMRKEAARLREYVGRLNRESERASANAPGSYVTGPSGRSAAQNRATDRALEKTIRNAGKAVAATKRADELEREADYIESGGPAKLATRRAQNAADFKAAKAALLAGPLEDRLFSGNYPCAVVYADRAVERGGDYRPLAMLPYDTLQMIYEKDCPAMWRPILEAKAAAMQARVGEQYQISTCGQYVILGSRITKEGNNDNV